MSGIFKLEAVSRPSRVLGDWLKADPAAARRAGVVQNQTVVTTSSDLEGMRALFAPINTPSGFAVTDQTAMLVSTVFACLSKISGAVLQLPVHQYSLNIDGDRDRMAPTPLWWMLNESPSAQWTAASWKEWIVRCVHLRGDQHTQILRGVGSNAGGITGLKPLHPDWVQTRPVDGRLRYDVYDPYTRQAYGVDQDDMLHFAGFGFDGVRSLSAIQYAARTAISNSLAAGDYSGRTVGEGAMPKIALTYPNKLGKDQQELLRESFVATYTGPGAQKLPLILTEGGLAKELSMSPVDLQLLDSRRFEREDICQALGVPPVMIGENAKTSSWGTGVEQITLGFVKFTLKPHLCRWEEEMNRKLFRRAGQFVEFELDALLRGDSKAQAEVYRAALGGPGTGDGWMSTNQVRRLQNLKPLPGKEYDEPYRAQRGTAATQPAAEGATA